MLSHYFHDSNLARKELVPFLRELRDVSSWTESALAIRGTDLCNWQMLHCAKHCPKLQSLDICSNKRITKDGILAIARDCPSVSSLRASELFLYAPRYEVFHLATSRSRRRCLSKSPFATSGYTVLEIMVYGCPATTIGSLQPMRKRTICC